jgi:UDP-2,3-diacylglucosamine pyrophosphatase LpxH
VGKFEECIGRYAKEHAAHGVVCGHIHVPTVRELEGLTYYNCGEWVESCSALVEHMDGTIELLNNLHEPNRVVPIAAGPVGSFEEFDEVARRLRAR